MDSLEFKLLLNKVYRLLSIRLRSEKEIRDYLRVKGVRDKGVLGQEVIEQIIDKLKQLNLINDLEFAKKWYESRSRKKGMRVIRLELIQKGISKDIIEQITGDGLLVHEEGQSARQLLEKKMKIWKNLPLLEFKKKAYEFLLRRGFNFDVVRVVVEKTTELR